MVRAAVDGGNLGATFINDGARQISPVSNGLPILSDPPLTAGRLG